jgi:hypothetical protein
MPINPNKPKAIRQFTNASTAATSAGVNAPPHRALNQSNPWARTRSVVGSQIVNTLVIFGKQPASPIPNSARHTSSETRFQAQPVAAVKSDHSTTTFISTLRGPNRSPIQPAGISNSA